MLFASTWGVLEDFTALGLSHSEKQDHKLWQHLQDSLGGLKSHLSMNPGALGTVHSFFIPLEEINPKRNVVGLLSVSNPANEEGAPDSQLHPIKPMLLCACSDPLLWHREWPAPQVQTGVK